MKKKHIIEIICALIGATGAIVAGGYAGVQIERNNQQNIQAEYIQSQTTNIIGDNNTVKINDVDDLLSEYKELYDENKALRKQNTKYIDELSESEDNVNYLKSQVDDTPEIELSDLSLKVNGDPVSINSTNARAKIDGKEYFSREITEKLLSENQSIKVKDNTLYIGKVIADQASLFDQYVVDTSGLSDVGTHKDSFGNTLPNSIYFDHDNAYSIYNVNKKYKYLKFDYVALEDTYLDVFGTIIVKADDVIVYTSDEITKTDAKKQAIDIPINNCSLLEIEYSNTYTWFRCIMSNAILYN